MRVIQPVLISCIIPTMVEKAVAVSALYIMDRTIPEISCRDNVIPKRNPIFHINEMDEGVGRSSREIFMVFRMGFFLVLDFFIRILRKPFEWGGMTERLGLAL